MAGPQEVPRLPVPEALALREGQNVVLEAKKDITHGTKQTLTFDLPGVQGQVFRLAYINWHLEPPTPYVPMLVNSIMLYKPKADGGMGQPVPLIVQGAPYIESIMGNGQNTFLVFALERVEPKSRLEIEVENIDAAADAEVSVVLWGDLREE